MKFIKVFAATAVAAVEGREGYKKIHQVHTPESSSANHNRGVNDVYTPSTCTAGFVDCVNGFVRDSHRQELCADSCGLDCCLGPNACLAFTGRVCRDGSCSGDMACQDAVIPEVINSCKSWGSQGTNVCFSVGNTTGMVDSCWGQTACMNMGHSNGKVGTLTNSCHSVGPKGAPGTCYLLGYAGTVGEVTSSCFGQETCNQLGHQGVVGPVINSCGSQINGVSDGSIDTVTGYSVMGYRNCYQADFQDWSGSPIYFSNN